MIPLILIGVTVNSKHYSSDPPYQNFIYPSPLGLTVPEPSGLGLLGAAFVAMVFVTRRRRTGVHSAS